MRLNRGWSRRTLAVKAGITDRTVWNLEAGETKAQVQERIRAGLAKALEVEQSDLFKKDGRVR